MSTFQSKGIIFKNIKYGESSIICDIFTEERGLRSFIVSGFRSGKSATKSGIFRPLHIVDLTAYDSGSGKLSRIKEIQFANVYETLNIHVVKSSMALFMLEVARNAIRMDDKDKELFRFLESQFIRLDKDKMFSPLTHILFMIQLSSFLGFGPLQNHSTQRQVFDLLNGQFDHEENVIQYRMDRVVSDYLRQLLETTSEKLPDIQIPKAVRIELLDDLLLYYKLHVPGFKDVVSKDVLTAVL
jgi:DNA repair protein RecO (recombination protein O)